MEGHLLTQHPCSIFTHRRPPPLSQPPYRDAKPINPKLSSLFRCSFSTRYRPRDSHAETVGSSQKFSSKDEDVEDQDSEFGFGRSRGRNKKRRWWSDDNSSSPEMEEGPAGIFEQAIDTFWILKVAILVFTPFLSLRIGWLLGCFQFLLSYLFWSFLVTSFSRSFSVFAITFFKAQIVTFHLRTFLLVFGPKSGQRFWTLMGQLLYFYKIWLLKCPTYVENEHACYLSDLRSTFFIMVDIASSVGRYLLVGNPLNCVGWWKTFIRLVSQQIPQILFSQIAKAKGVFSMPGILKIGRQNLSIVPMKKNSTEYHDY